MRTGFSQWMFPSEISTLTVDLLNKDILCRGLPALTTFISVGCPPSKEIKVSKRVTACSKGILDPSLLQNNFTYILKKEIYNPSLLLESIPAEEDLIVTYDYAAWGCPLVAHYGALWSPELQLWNNDEFVEIVDVEYVIFEVHGVHDYNYQLYLSDINCVSEAQNWTTMLKKQAIPDPHTAWNSKNFHSCHDPGEPITTPGSTEYQIMGGCILNRILFPKRNGFYIFKIIVVNSTYSLLPCPPRIPQLLG
uniref:cation channel sperm-associated auxiliary subunit delta-like isoform X3 n=1 Tax=Pristiophorus japonicus TaxID=55135 RepID=UPI00398E586F